ncbi:32651_t:CDS:2, partial [Racocetra persica]
ETQSELEKLKQERMQICIQADKNSETNSSVLDKILDEMGVDNDKDLTDDDDEQADIETAPE